MISLFSATKHFKRGLAHYEAGNWSLAVCSLSWALWCDLRRNSPLRSETSDFGLAARADLYNAYYAYLLRGLCYQQLDKLELALVDFSRAYRQHPHGHDIQLRRGRCLLLIAQRCLAHGDWGAALEYGRKSLSAATRNPQSAADIQAALELYCDLADLGLRLGDAKLAFKALDYAGAILSNAHFFGGDDSIIEFVPRVIHQLDAVVFPQVDQTNVFSIAKRHIALGQVCLSKPTLLPLAELRFRKAFNLLAGCAVSSNVDWENLELLAMTHNLLGIALTENQNWLDAKDCYQKAIAVRKRIAELRAHDHFNSVYIAGAHCNLAQSQMELGELGPATVNYLKAFKMLRGHIRDHSANCWESADVAQCFLETTRSGIQKLRSMRRRGA